MEKSSPSGKKKTQRKIDEVQAQYDVLLKEY